MGIGEGLGRAAMAYEKDQELIRKRQRERVMNQSPYDSPAIKGYDMSGEYSGTSDKAMSVLNAVSKNEGTFKTGYNTEYGYGEYGTTRPDLSEMTLNEVMDYQKYMVDSNTTSLKSSAIGRYQMLNQTIKDEMKHGGYLGTDLFTNEMQDKMMMGRLRRRHNYDEWEAGTYSDNDFKRNLSREFASVIDPYTGKGHYGQGAKELRW